MEGIVNDAGTELLQFLCTHPTTEFSISELAEENGISKPWAAEKVDEFREEGIVTVEEKGNMKQVRFNRDSDGAKRLKQVINLEAFRRSGVLDEIVETFSYPETVVLFGSFAKGEDVERSDIDIAVISTEEGDVEGSILERDVSLHVFNPGEVPGNMVESLANGIVLYGHLEVGK